MLKIKCPVCGKFFFWTDDMPVDGKCSNPDCNWRYDIHSELKKNVDRRDEAVAKEKMQCPFCEKEITARYTVCRHCSRVVLGDRTFKKSHIFVAACLLLVLLSLIFKYGIQ